MNDSLSRLPREPADRLTKPFMRFLRIEATAGIILLLSTLLALGLANTAWSSSFLAFWEMPAGVRLGDIGICRSLKHWTNDGLMTFFFFVIALELKRELVLGELRNPRMAALPVAAALGGMAAPAGIYCCLSAEGRVRAAGAPLCPRTRRSSSGALLCSVRAYLVACDCSCSLLRSSTIVVALEGGQVCAAGGCHSPCGTRANARERIHSGCLGRLRAGRRGCNPSRIEPDDGCSKTSYHQADGIGFCPFKALFECHVLFPLTGYRGRCGPVFNQKTVANQIFICSLKIKMRTYYYFDAIFTIPHRQFQAKIKFFPHI